MSLRKAFLLTTAVVLAPAAYAGEVAEPMRFSKIVGERPEVKLGRFHEAANDAVCARFRPDEKLIRFFLSKAVVVEGEVLEREYPWYPCWIEVAVNGERSFACEITPAGRGSCKSPNAEVTYLVCDHGCQAVFPDGGKLHETGQ